MMLTPLSTMGVTNTTKGASSVDHSQPVEASAAVRPSGGAQNRRTAEIPAARELNGRSSPAVDEQAVEEIVDDLNEFAQQVERQLQFSVDKNSGQTVIKVIDATTEEVVRQIPADEILTLKRRLGDVQGLLFKTEA